MADRARYPIGPFDPHSARTSESRVRALQSLMRFPSELDVAVAGLLPADLQKPYRTGGWTLTQVTHHVADSHTLGFVRFKHGLTEECPILNPYDQDTWAGLPDTRLPIAVSLRMIEAVHARWFAVASNMTDTE